MPFDGPITVAEAKEAERSLKGKFFWQLQYKIALASVKGAIQKTSGFTLTEALSVAMAALNRIHYQHVGFDNEHFEEIGKLLTATDWETYRERKLIELTEADASGIQTIFGQFETVLGPVGASRALNLLAPEFFPIWTRPITKAYGTKLIGTKPECYWQFMELMRPRYLELKQFLPDTKFQLLIILNEINVKQ